MTAPKRLCIYCDEPTRKGGKGEHIIPEAIGGGRTLNHGSGRVVCITCNNEDLGNIDKEFSSKSYLSIVSSQEINSFLSMSWNIDHSADDLLIEAKPVWIDGLLADMICYPQITFEKTGVHIRGDAKEMQAFGNDGYYRVLTLAAKAALHRHKKGNTKKRAIHFEKIESFMEEGNVRLAPRLFTREPIADVAENINNTSFILRYVKEHDRNFAMKNLDGLNQDQQFPSRKFRPGSLLPRVSCSFNVDMTIRGLMKMGVNLIAAYCPNTPVNPKNFEAPIDLILGKCQSTMLLIKSNGFVAAEGVQSITPNKAHSFRLVNLDGVWHVWSSFFGGRMGAYVCFPGPNKESWNSLDVVAPLKTKDWQTKTSTLFLGLTAKVEWNDTGNLCPSMKIQGTKSAFRAELVPIRKRKERKKPQTK